MDDYTRKRILYQLDIMAQAVAVLRDVLPPDDVPVEPGSYKKARGILPWSEGDELPATKLRCVHCGHILMRYSRLTSID